MTDRKWIDPSQPQTLQAAVLFCYINTAIAFIYLLAFGATPSLLLIALGVSAFFIANERRWAYFVACGVAILFLGFQLVAFVFSHGAFGGILPLLFTIVLVVLLLHPQSREYQKIWFH